MEKGDRRILTVTHHAAMIILHEVRLTSIIMTREYLDM